MEVLSTKYNKLYRISTVYASRLGEYKMEYRFYNILKGYYYYYSGLFIS